MIWSNSTKCYPLALVLLFGGINSVWAQKAKRATVKQTDVIEVLVKALNIKIKEKHPDRKRVSFSIIPVSTTTSGGNKILVSSISMAFILGHKDSTKVSSVYLLPYTDFSENFGIGLRTNLWTPKNNWNIPTEFRISTLTQYNYGLGSSSTENNLSLLKYNYVRAYFTLNRRVNNHIYAGLGLNYDRYYKVGEENAPYVPSDFEKYGIGTGESSLATGITLNGLYDDRRNSINPEKGHYASMVLRVNPPSLKNETSWTSLYLDYREYFELDAVKRKVFAVWAMYWGSFGDVPYFNLPGTGLEFGARSGRGYSQARFRGKHMAYFEGEYRFDITNNGLLGAVVFFNMQSLTEEASNKFETINPGGGAGIRIKFNKESKTNITVDFGFGKNSFGISVGLGEVF